MAEGKKLWLELGLDITDFEAAMVSAEKTTGQKQKRLNDSLSQVNKAFEIQINNAKLAGDSEKALALDIDRLVAKVELLKTAEENLAKARDAAKESGNEKEIAAAQKAYENTLIRRQKMELALADQRNKIVADAEAKRLKEAEKAAKAKAEAERKAAIEAEKLAKAKAEADRKAAIEAEKLAKAKAEAERKASIEAEKTAKKLALAEEKRAKAKAEAERKLAAEAEQAAKKRALVEERARATLRNFALTSEFGAQFSTAVEATGALSAAADLLGVTLSGPLTLGFGAAAAAGIGFKKAIDAAEESALKAAQDGKEVYRIMSITGMKQSDAERFGDAFSIAGESADTAIQAILRLNKAMKEAGENGTKLTAALSKYGVDLYDKDGHLKKYEEQLLALSDAYKTAKAAGLGQEFAAEIFGGRGAGMLPILEKWEEVYKLAGNANSTGFMQAEEQTRMLMLQKQLEAVQRHTSSRFGDTFTEAMTKHLERSVEIENERAEAIKKSKAAYESLGRILDGMFQKWDAVSKAAGEVKLAAEQTGIGMLASIFDRESIEKGVKEELAALEKYGGLEGLKAHIDAEVEVKEKAVDTDRQKKAAEMKERVDAANKAEAEKKAAAEREKLQKQQAAEAEKLQKEQLAKQKQAIQERENAEKRINSILQSSYQNRLQQIEQEKQAWIKAGADRVNAALAAEKQIADARKSEAEKALTSQKDLWRAYMKMGDTQEFQDYALKKNMRSMGISKKDYESMNVNALEGFMNAMDKFKSNTWLSQLNNAGSLSAIGNDRNNQTPVNNEVHIEVKLDNVVVEDMGTIERLANKVSDAIIPEVKKAIDGGAAYGY